MVNNDERDKKTIACNIRFIDLSCEYHLKVEAIEPQSDNKFQIYGIVCWISEHLIFTISEKLMKFTMLPLESVVGRNIENGMFMFNLFQEQNGNISARNTKYDEYFVSYRCWFVERYLNSMAFILMVFGSL